MKAFGNKGINLSCITSFPDKKAATYGFFVEFEGHVKDKHVTEALEEIKSFTTFLNIKGSFPAANPNEV